jgi:hypothetical protein
LEGRGNRGGMFTIVWSLLSAALAMKPKFEEKVKLKNHKCPVFHYVRRYLAKAGYCRMRFANCRSETQRRVLPLNTRTTRIGRGFQTTKTKTTNGFSGHLHEQKETKSSPAKHANDANWQRGFWRSGDAGSVAQFSQRTYRRNCNGDDLLETFQWRTAGCRRETIRSADYNRQNVASAAKFIGP